MAAVMDYFRSCWGRSGGRKGADAAGRQDGLLWYKDAGQTATGEFSMAVVQANNLLEDQSQVESGPLSMADPGPQGTFVGVYDGHGGPETSRFVNDNMFHHLKRRGRRRRLVGRRGRERPARELEHNDQLPSCTASTSPSPSSRELEHNDQLPSCTASTSPSPSSASSTDSRGCKLPSGPLSVAASSVSGQALQRL